MSKRKQDEKIHDDGTYVVKKTRKGSMIAFVLCALIALIIWLYATNDERKKAELEQLPTTVAESTVNVSELVA